MRLSLFLLFAAFAYAEPEFNVAPPFYNRPLASYTGETLPKWLRLSGEIRARAEGRTGFGFVPDNNDGYGLIRSRLNIEIIAAKWLDFYFQGQDSRSPGVDPGRAVTTFRDPFDLRQAYVRIGKADGLVKLTVGRQQLLYGNQRLIGPSDWTNNARSWDAVRLEIGTADAKVDLFASSVVVIDPNGRIDHHRDGNNIHGAYGAFKKVVPHSVFEPYLLWKTGHLSIWSGGVRVAAMPGTPGLRGFDYQLEFVRQWGHIGALDHRAWAGYVIGGYTIPKVKWSPRFSAEFSHASGDPNPGAGPHRTFDQLLPTNHMHYGITDPIGWQNMNMPRAGFDFKPLKRLQLFTDYRWLWLDSAKDAYYAISGSVAVRPLAGNTARAIGRELDFSGMWTLSPVWKIGGGVGHLTPGEFLKRNSKGSPQTFPYLFAQYSF